MEDAGSRCGESTEDYLIRSTSDVVDRLLDEDAEQLQRLAAIIDRDISMQIEPSCQPGEFDIVLR